MKNVEQKIIQNKENLKTAELISNYFCLTCFSNFPFCIAFSSKFHFIHVNMFFDCKNNGTKFTP